MVAVESARGYVKRLKAIDVHRDFDAISIHGRRPCTPKGVPSVGGAVGNIPG